MIGRIKKYINDYLDKKFNDPITKYPKGSCHEWICSGFIYRYKTYEERVWYTLYCMFESDDPVMNKVIHIVVRERYPEYIGVLENPDKYRILL